ncbi:MAG: hypothetical protein AAFY28_10270 [Actinomycetota bacterium]
MSEQHISQLTARLTGDEALRGKVLGASSDQHRSILNEAGVDDHEQLDDEQLAAVVGGISDALGSVERIQEELDTTGGFGAGFDGP